jgi:hypothetical protein
MLRSGCYFFIFVCAFVYLLLSSNEWRSHCLVQLVHSVCVSFFAFELVVKYSQRMPCCERMCMVNRSKRIEQISVAGLTIPKQNDRTNPRFHAIR